MRYLVVDDSRTSRLALAAAIRRSGQRQAEIIEADSVDQALERFGDQPVDMVFLDMMLDPEAHRAGGQAMGLAVLERLLDKDPGMRIVLVTALPPENSDVVHAISLGAFAHLPKPVRVEKVKEVLNEAEREDGRLERIK